MVPVTFTLGSSRQSTVALEGKGGDRSLGAHLGRYDRQLGYAHYHVHLQ